MKTIAPMILLSLLLLNYGCGALKVSPVETGGAQDVVMVEDKDLGQVYLAQGFNFKGFDIILVLDTSTSAVLEKKEIDPDELAIYLKHSLVKKLNEVGVFTKVTDDKSVLSPQKGVSAKVLVLESSFTEMDPGSRALRWVAGLYGAGRVKVQLESEIRDPQTKQLYFKSSNRRIGMMGAFGGNSKDFILESLDEISASHSAFIKRISSGGKAGTE